MWKIREQIDKVTNVVMMYTDSEIKVREATNDEQWGPHGTLMAEIAKLTYRHQCYQEVMGMLWKRMFHEEKLWRRLAKCLQLLNYLILNGSERVINTTREHLYDLRELENFHQLDENGKDQGINVRVKSKDIVELLKNDDRLRDERKRAKNTQGKYVGMASYTQDGGGFSRNNNSSFAGDYIERFKDTLKQIGVERDYSEYNVDMGRRQDTYRDEPDHDEQNYKKVGELEDSYNEEESRYKKYEDEKEEIKEETLVEKVVSQQKSSVISSTKNETPLTADDSDFGDFQTIAPIEKVENVPVSPPPIIGVNNSTILDMGLNASSSNKLQNVNLGNGNPTSPKIDAPISPFDEFDPLVFGQTSNQVNTVKPTLNSQCINLPQGNTVQPAIVNENNLFQMSDILQPEVQTQTPNMNQTAQYTNKMNWMNTSQAPNPRASFAYNQQPMAYQNNNNNYAMSRPSFNNTLGNTNFANFQNQQSVPSSNMMFVNNQMASVNLVSTNWPS